TFTALDITSLKEKELELLDSEEKYRSIMDSMDDAAYICSSKYLIEYMNSAMVERTGSDATGELCYKVIHGLDKKCPWCLHEKVMRGETIKKEIISPKDGNPYYISSSPVYHTDGSMSELAVFRDISEIKKMESRIQQSQKMESIGTLAGGIAHDFNNILFPIVGHTEMLLEDIPGNSPFRTSLNQIYTSAMRASELVKQILTFSRQESGEMKLMKMQPVIKEALKLIRSTIPATIEIKQNINADCGVIKADPIHIHQIIMNLTTNAYHAMEDTGGELTVSLKKIKLGTYDLINPNMKSGAYACLSVSDTGAGMDKILTDKIFDPFFTTKENGKGTGMGLSVVHGIVINMNGGIQVYSEPGKGTVFHVYLPVEKSVFEKQAIHSKTEIQGGTEQILLVDDEEAILSMEKRMLERLGYQVTSRSSSIEALEVFRADPDKFGMVITDLAMPNMPGNKLAVELTGIRSDIPILLCTGFSETMSEEKMVSLGINGVLLKPIVMKDLSRKIREVLD
ncbi:MAG: response regulator, partial [Desulfobacterales bacterium]|nr:response regulator [Desulfobacterales bacterium]